MWFDSMASSEGEEDQQHDGHEKDYTQESQLVGSFYMALSFN